MGILDNYFAQMQAETAQHQAQFGMTPSGPAGNPSAEGLAAINSGKNWTDPNTGWVYSPNMEGGYNNEGGNFAGTQNGWQANFPGFENSGDYYYINGQQMPLGGTGFGDLMSSTFHDLAPVAGMVVGGATLGAGLGALAAGGAGAAGGVGAADASLAVQGNSINAFEGGLGAAGGGGGAGVGGMSGMDLAADGAPGMSIDSAAPSLGGGGSAGMSQADIENLMRDGGAAGGAGGGGLSSLLQTPAGLQALTTLVGGGLSLASGNKASGQIQDLLNKSDPFAQYRPMYGQMLESQMTHPNVAGLPGYQAGLEAVQRAGAGQGFTGSGNMEASLLKYGGDFWQQQEQNLATLAGANISPNSAPFLNAIGGAQTSQNAGIVNLLKGGAGILPYLSNGGSTSAYTPVAGGASAGAPQF